MNKITRALIVESITQLDRFQYLIPTNFRDIKEGGRRPWQ
jgi:hypothetical protein